MGGKLGGARDVNRPADYFLTMSVSPYVILLIRSTISDDNSFKSFSWFKNDFTDVVHSVSFLNASTDQSERSNQMSCAINVPSATRISPIS